MKYCLAMYKAGLFKNSESRGTFRYLGRNLLSTLGQEILAEVSNLYLGVFDFGTKSAFYWTQRE